MNNKTKQNCWEYKKCGRGPNKAGGLNNDICPAAADSACNKVNGGVNGGRICWIVAGTFCDRSVQGTFAQKRRSCISCDFFKLVEAQEGYENFIVLKPGQKYVPAD